LKRRKSNRLELRELLVRRLDGDIRASSQQESRMTGNLEQDARAGLIERLIDPLGYQPAEPTGNTQYVGQSSLMRSTTRSSFLALRSLNAARMPSSSLSSGSSS